MTYPITKETISKSIFIVEKTSGEKATQVASDIVELLVQHINAAYIQSYSDGIRVNAKGSGVEL